MVHDAALVHCAGVYMEAGRHTAMERANGHGLCTPEAVTCETAVLALRLRAWAGLGSGERT